MRLAYLIVTTILLLFFKIALPTYAQENFVRTEEFLEATRDADAPVRKRVTTVYYDGLGRERWRVVGIGEQVVSTCDEQAGPASAVTSRTDYDGRGNVWRQWLPVPGDVRTDNSYESKANFLYGSYQFPYTQISYEESGRNRPIYNQGPGKHWHGKGVKTEYHRCALNGDYACRALLADCESGKVTIKNIYAPGTLAVTVCENNYDEIGRLASRTLEAAHISYEYDIRQHTTGIVADAYTERASYTEGPDGQTRSYKFVNATTDSWNGGSNITLGYTYDGFGRMAEAVSTDGTLSETLGANLDATVTDVVRRYNNAVVQYAKIDIDGALPTGVSDESSPYYSDAVGRFAPGDYAMAYDSNGRLTADGTRGVTSVSYHPWLNLPLVIKFDSGDWTRSEYLPDGTLRSRFTQTRRIDPVSAINLNTNLTTGTAEPMAVSPNLRTTRRYRGSFEIVSGAENYARVNTSTGYYDCKEKRHYYYLTNRQGSVMAVIDDHGTTVQRTGLYPSGTPFILPSDYGKFIANSTQTLTSATDRLHIGNRWLGHSGLNRYDNTARLHDPLLCRFDTPDPLATKFPALNPWTHTAANPANLVDFDGKEVRLLGHNIQDVVAELNHTTSSITLETDSDGNLFYNKSGSKELTVNDKRVAEIIDDKQISINFNSREGCITTQGNLFYGGAFMGNEVSEINGQKHVTATQEVFIPFLSKMSRLNKSPGADMLHELTEAYEGAKHSLSNGVAAKPALDDNSNEYRNAHNKASPQTNKVSVYFFNKWDLMTLPRDNNGYIKIYNGVKIDENNLIIRINLPDKGK